jgi:hypothetical protein
VNKLQPHVPREAGVLQIEGQLRDTEIRLLGRDHVIVQLDHWHRPHAAATDLRDERDDPDLRVQREPLMAALEDTLVRDPFPEAF